MVYVLAIAPPADHPVWKYGMHEDGELYPDPDEDGTGRSMTFEEYWALIAKYQSEMDS